MYTESQKEIFFWTHFLLSEKKFKDREANRVFEFLLGHPKTEIKSFAISGMVSILSEEADLYWTGSFDELENINEREKATVSASYVNLVESVTSAAFISYPG